jgi:steroid 5-alpha reductase family enzyme
MSIAATYLLAAAVVLALMIYLWLVSLRLRNSSIIDPFWSLGFFLATYLYFSFGAGAPLRKLIILVLVLVWGARLALYLYLRNRGKGEDKRYAVWRTQAGKAWWWQSLFKVFLLQGLLIWWLSVPLLLSQFSPDPAILTLLDAIGMLIWLIGLMFESVADLQLARFRSQPKNKGKVLDKGLWAWTRHPNYFGESLIWWGYGLIAAATGAWWVLFAPALMTLLLLKISGVPLLEKQLEETKPNYRAYAKRISPFLPLPPRSRP